MIYELLVLDAEDTRDFAYHAERLFFTTPEAAETYYLAHFQSPNLFWKVKRYPVDGDGEAETVTGNWTRANLVQYYNEKS